MPISFRRHAFGVALALSSLALPACSSSPADQATADAATDTLPYVGAREMQAPGGDPADTLYSIPKFTLTDQARHTVTNDTFKNKIYVTDFFFATCPSICPKMQSELLRVYEQYKNDPRVVFMSHTIDPAHDSIPVLRDYAERLGVTDASRWHFVTAPHDTIFALAKAYMTGAEVDPNTVGGFAHNGTFALVDEHRHVRGLYDGLEKDEVDRLIREIPVLLKEEGAPAQPTPAAQP